MSTLTYAQAWTQISSVVNLFQKTELFCASASPNWVGLENTLRSGTVGEYFQQVLAGVAPSRAALSQILSPENVRGALAGPLLDMAGPINAPERDVAGIMRRLYEYMRANSKTVNSRGISYATPSAGSNTGNGSVYRITADENGFSLEGCHTELKTLECVLDQGQVDRHSEIWELRGVEPERDLLSVAGSGVVARLRSLTIRDTQVLLRNPGFDQLSGTQPSASTPVTPASTTSISGWTLDATTSVTVGIDTPAVYRTPFGETAAKWVKFGANRTMGQTINSELRAKLRIDVPYLFQIAVYRESSADGTLTLRVGAVSRAITVTTLNNSAWNVVTVPATLGANSWFLNINEDNFDISIEWASRTTGNLYFDDIIWAPMSRIDGTFWAVVGGSTPWKRRDSFTMTDSEATRGILQYWLAFRSGIGISLPSNAAAGETEADPS